MKGNGVGQQGGSNGVITDADIKAVGQQGGSIIFTTINRNPKISFGVFGAIAVLGLALFAYGLSIGSTTNGAFISGVIFMAVGSICYGLLWRTVTNKEQREPTTPANTTQAPVNTTPLTPDQDPRNSADIRTGVNNLLKSDKGEWTYDEAFEQFMLGHMGLYFDRYKEYYIQRKDSLCKGMVAQRLKRVDPPSDSDSHEDHSTTRGVDILRSKTDDWYATTVDKHGQPLTDDFFQTHLGHRLAFQDVPK